MDHKKLKVWQEAIDLVANIYQLTGELPPDEKFGLVSQMRRSAISIPSNIAEGMARKSNKESTNFLYISLGSLAEIETQLIITERIGLLNKDQTLCDSIIEIRRMLFGLINYLKKDL